MESLSTVTDAIIAEMKAKNPNAKLVLIESQLDDDRQFDAIFLQPSNESISKYVSANAKASTSGNKDSLRAHAAFVMENILFPSRDDFFEIQKTLPLLSIALANDLMSGAGLTKESKKKTL